VKLLRNIFPTIIFIFSLFIFSSILFLQRAFMTNFDEYDHIAAGYLMSLGKKIYLDFFSHHFPFPYYWTSFFTPFWNNELFSRSITIFRGSLILFYLISFLIVFFLLKNIKSKISFSLWIALLSLFISLYHGNLILSESFSAIAIFSLFWIVAPIVLGWEESDFRKTIASVFFASIGFWTQPLLLILFPIPLLLSPRNNRVKISLALLLLNLFPILLFFLSGQLVHFIEQGFWFNFKVYPKYFIEERESNSKIFQSLICFINNEKYFLSSFGNYVEQFQFILHLFFLFFIGFVLKKKKLNLLIIVFLIFLSTRVREIKIFPGQIFNFGIFPFLTIASSSLILLTINYYKKLKIFSFFILAAPFMLSFQTVNPIIEQSLKPGYNYHVFWSYRQDNGKILQDLSFPNEKILVYPHDVDLYFFAQRQPPDRFLYWFPWIDSVNKYREERLDVLVKNPPPVIFIGSLAFKNDPRFYEMFFPNLLNDYLLIYKNNQATGVYIRKDLLERVKPPYQVK